MIICSTTWWAMPGRVFWSRSNSTAPASADACRAQSPVNRSADFDARGLHRYTLFTVGDGPSELQQTAEGQRGDMRLPPALRLLLDIFLKLDPAGRLLPLHLLVLVHRQLVQLHKHLETHTSAGETRPNRPHTMTCTLMPNTQMSKALLTRQLVHSNTNPPHLICPPSFSL